MSLAIRFQEIIKRVLLTTLECPWVSKKLVCMCEVYKEIGKQETRIIQNSDISI